MADLIAGLDHIYLSVRDFDTSEKFYDNVMQTLGLFKGNREIAGERHAHYLAPNFQLTIRPARSKERFDAYRSGLHHLCLQASSAEAIDACYKKLKTLGLTVTAPAHYPEYHPEYYAIFFEDPDGIRLEIVGRTSYRQRLADEWDELDTFLNPLQALDKRKGNS